MAIEHVVGNILLVVLVILYLISDYRLEHLVVFLIIVAVIVTFGFAAMFLFAILFLGWAAS
jgi:hypothetical protein